MRTAVIVLFSVCLRWRSNPKGEYLKLSDDQTTVIIKKKNVNGLCQLYVYIIRKYYYETKNWNLSCKIFNQQSLNLRIKFNSTFNFWTIRNVKFNFFLSQSRRIEIGVGLESKLNSLNGYDQELWMGKIGIFNWNYDSGTWDNEMVWQLF